MATGNEMYVQLYDMRKQAGTLHFKRVTLAQKLLQDRSWVTALDGGGGDESKAIDRLESECFGDLCGLCKLPQLFNLLKAYPTAKEWADQKCDLGKMIAKMNERSATAKVKTTRSVTSTTSPQWMSAAEFFNLTARKQEREYHRLETLAQKAVRLEEENKQLRAENATLRQELKNIKDAARQMIA